MRQKFLFSIVGSVLLLMLAAGLYNLTPHIVQAQEPAPKGPPPPETPDDPKNKFVAGLAYSGSPNGPWKLIPERGKKGFPLTYDQRYYLYIKTLKKYPDYPWPQQQLPRPIGHFPATYYSYSQDTVVFKPGSVSDVKPQGSFCKFMAGYDSDITREILILPPRPKLPWLFGDWSDLQRVESKLMVIPLFPYSVPNVHQPVLNFPANAAPKFRVRARAVIQRMAGHPPDNVAGIQARLIAKDASGKVIAMKTRQLLADDDTDTTNDFTVTLPTFGHYTFELELLGPDGKDVKSAAGNAKTGVGLRPIGITPNAPPAIIVAYGAWEPAAEPEVWQRQVQLRNAVPTSGTMPVNGFFDFKIVPFLGFPDDKRVSWLSAKSTNVSSSDGYSLSSPVNTGIIQYYRATRLGFPDDASNQMEIYGVRVSPSRAPFKTMRATIQ